MNVIRLLFFFDKINVCVLYERILLYEQNVQRKENVFLVGWYIHTIFYFVLKAFSSIHALSLSIHSGCDVNMLLN